ncbi:MULTISPECIES: sigma-54-dependent Fis family transcriptional regulator [unclassified Anaeromyxobacter]|uniref:sigma-54 interaction domain-containing protein n=1 Tax=unclassified Anaeromyxobacter TaxID=2620896 RepID=UPI001F574380|nr:MULTISPECIES: sigma 54-interacting transcriptional regulator [unclassified Anaeromyxobacter]
MPELAPIPLPFLGLDSVETLRRMADALPDGLFLTDREGTVTFWNRAAERITGWPRSEAIGQRCSILAGDSVNGCPCGAGLLKCGVAERSRSSLCCTIRKRDGAPQLIVKNAVPLFAADGLPAGTLETFTDVASAPIATAPPAGPAEPAALRDDGAPAGELCGLVGGHEVMRELFRMIALVARTRTTVMITGESGTGKDRVAEAIHRLGDRAQRPLVRVSCAALGPAALDVELFGDADGRRRGKIAEADGGTLVLDEVGDAPPAVQAKLLRVVEERAFGRAGEERPLAVDVRLLCTTHRDLRPFVKDGRLRADLYFRLAAFPLRVPPLREHAEDVPLLAERFLSELGSGRGLSKDALRLLRAYPWPGNVRELRNALEYAALRAGPGELRPEHLPRDVLGFRAERRSAPGAAPDPEAEARRALVEALERTGWNRTQAAELLGVSRVTLWKRMRRLGIADPGER